MLLCTAVPTLAASDAGFDVIETSVADLQSAMAAGRVTSEGLVNAYLARIEALDKNGPRLNALIELNPDARALATALDQERQAKGPRGPLHGIPVLIKNNMATADAMQTTAGSLALVGHPSPKDAFIVKKLRDAGAVILGKTNMTEWANIRASRSTSAWSARGGLTRNPYSPDRTPGGSSAGSAAATAASLAALSLGTETDGSITVPAAMTSLVGMKPTVGLVSRSGVMAIGRSQDTPGPLTRTVADAAALLTVIAGSDPQDPASSAATQHSSDFSQALQKDALKGKRIGVVRSQFASQSAEVAAVARAQLQVLKAQGAVLVDVAAIPNDNRYTESELTALLHEFKAELPLYLATYAPTAPVKNLADLIAFNKANAAAEMPHFGQDLFIRAQSKGDLASAAYTRALANNRKYAAEQGLDTVLSRHKLDALVAPTTGLPWVARVGKLDGRLTAFSYPPAVAGYPHITVPAGYVRGLPTGLSFVGPAWSDAKLIGMAYAYEQASLRRRVPGYTPVRMATR